MPELEMHCAYVDLRSDGWLEIIEDQSEEWMVRLDPDDVQLLRAFLERACINGVEMAVCDVCNTVVSKLGKDYATVPVFYRGEPDLHTGRSEKEIAWEDVCVPCFEKTYTRRIFHMITYNMIKPRLIARVSMETDHGPEVMNALEAAQTYREAVSVARRYRRRRPSLFVRLLECLLDKLLIG